MTKALVANLELYIPFYKFISERLEILIRKEVYKQRAPWTNDEILQKYKFCNVFREHDSSTVYLENKILTNKKLTLKDKVLNIYYFRFFNKNHLIWQILTIFLVLHSIPFKL